MAPLEFHGDETFCAPIPLTLAGGTLVRAHGGRDTRGRGAVFHLQI